MSALINILSSNPLNLVLAIAVLALVYWGFALFSSVK